MSLDDEDKLELFLFQPYKEEAPDKLKTRCYNQSDAHSDR